MSNKVLFFDTNFFLSKARRPDKDFFSKLSAEGFEWWVPRLVIEEIRANNRRDIKNHLEMLKKTASVRVVSLYLPIKEAVDAFDLDKAFVESDTKIDNYFSIFFSGRVLETSKDNAAFEVLLQRDAEKKPPFCDGKSDKGWKDTLIWVSILEYCKTTSFSDAFFVTSDNFDGGSAEMATEFKSVTNYPITFLSVSNCVDLLSKLGIKTNEASLEKEVSEPPFEGKTIEPNEEEIEKSKQAINGFLQSKVDTTPFGDEVQKSNFVFFERWDDAKTEQLCDMLLKDKDEYLFFDTILLNKYFTALSIDGHSEVALSVDAFKSFVLCWEGIIKRYPADKHKFISRVTDGLNSMVTDKSIYDVELPF